MAAGARASRPTRPATGAADLRTPRSWWVAAALAAAAVAGYSLLPRQTPAQVAGYLVLGAVGALWVVGGASTIGIRGQATPWRFLALAVLLFLTGDVLRVLVVQAWERGGFMPLARACYLLGYLASAATLYCARRSRVPARDRAELLDGAIITTGAGVLTWVLLVAPLVSEAGESMPGRALALVYPVGDLVLLAMLARLVTAPGAATVSYRIIVLSLICALVGDLAEAAAASSGRSVSAVAVDALTLAAYLGVGLAALHPSRRLVVAPPGPLSDRLTRRRLAALAAATLVAPALLLAQSWSGTEISATAIGLGSVLLALLVLARLALLLDQVQTQAATLAALAGQDALTGLSNRRTWDEALPRALRAADRSGAPLCIALLDLDHFKRFNDEHGHQVGDRLLRDAAASWQGRLRAGDLLARYGGEEFGLLLPGCSPPEALDLLARLRQVTPEGQTFSAGVAAYSTGEDSASLLARADAALYRAKGGGRDCVAVAADGA